ncbi:MAG: cyclic nucleotide-binding protein, partial [Ignavibacteria bacterium]|nr:cyclic nucleotide-binding protein [Ignavibacteria bacterium]
MELNKNSLGNFMEKVTLQDLRGDIYGGFTAMLVALPSAIAFGLVIFAPMGAQYIGYAALAGMIGTVLVAFFAALFGRTSRLISAPCAPAAAVLSAVVVELLHNSAIDKSQIPFYLLIVSCGAGIIQLLVGKLGGGRFIKYIPYPVVAGYLSGVGVLIFFGQLPRFLGLPAGTNTGNFFSQLPSFQPESLIIGGLTVITMAVAHKIIKQVPAAIVALCVGLLSYLALAQINPRLAVLANNSMIIGPISASPADIWAGISKNWGQITTWGHISWGYIAMPAFTLSVLLSMDTLKTCVVLDALTYSRHNSNRELMGQGIGNIASSLCGGIPGAGTMGATLVNLNSGGRSELSGIVVSLSALVVLLFLGSLIAWIPYSALAGILIVVAIRMIDIKSLRLLKHKSTRFDFFVVLAVVVAAVASNLLSAAGVGIAFAILLFLREQMRSSV